MRYFSKLLIVRFSFLVCFSLFAQTASALELTLDDCVSLALENNRWLKSREMEVKIAEEDVRIAASRLLPALKLKGNYDLRDREDFFLVPRDTFLTGVPPADVELSADNRETYGIALSVEQPIFTGFRLSQASKKSRFLSEETRYDVERKRRLLILEVKKVFHDILKEQSYGATLEKMLEAKRESRRVLEERLREGYAKKEDLLIADNDLAAAELDLLKARNRAETALGNLKRLIYAKDDEPIVVQGEPFNGTLVAPLEEVKEHARVHREDLKMFAARVQAAGSDVTIARSDFLPQVSLEGKYLVQRETNVTRPEQWMLSLQLDWSLFEWNRTKAEVAKAKALKLKQQYELEDLTKRVSVEAEDAWRAVQEKVKEVEVKEKRLATAEYSFKQTAEKYSEGTIKMVTFLSAEAELMRAYHEYLIAVNDLNVSMAELEVIASGLPEAWLKRGVLYKPDFAALSLIKKDAMARKEAKRPAYLNAKGKPPQKEALSEKGASVSSSGTLPDKAPTIAVQVGAFKAEEAALSVKKSLQKKIAGKKIRICQQGEYYKVRITGFRDVEEAKSFVSSGIDGLVIRTGEQACGI